MKVLTVFIGFFVIVTSLPTEKLLAEKWLTFKTNFGKTYSTLDEESKRFAIYKENVQKIDAHNELYEAGKSSYKMGVNKFADWSQEDFSSFVSNNLAGNGPRQSGQIHRAQKTGNLPSEVDWRKNGSVTDVKEQGLVVSSISFSITGAVEGAYQIASGNLISLSEKNLVDCSKYYIIDDAYEYIQIHGIESEESYPNTTDIIDVCQAQPSIIITKISSYVHVEKTANDLASAVATVGPVSVLMELSDGLVYYESGILDNEGCLYGDSNRSLAGLVVGYGSEEGEDYWIIKNSFGPGWGEEGYFRVIRDDDNRCEIYNNATYPVI